MTSLHADDSESSPQALGASPNRILDFTGHSSQASAPEQAHSGLESEPLAVDIGSSRNTSAEGLKCPVTSSFSHPEQQASGVLRLFKVHLVLCNRVKWGPRKDILAPHMSFRVILLDASSEDGHACVHLVTAWLLIIMWH